MKYPSRRSMTSGTPESTQNWVLAGFQNSLDLASMSPLEANAMSSSATATSACAPLGTLHIRAPAPGHPAHRRLVQPNKYRMQPIGVNQVYISYIFPQPGLLSRLLPADTVRAVTCTTTHVPDQ